MQPVSTLTKEGHPWLTCPSHQSSILCPYQWHHFLHPTSPSWYTHYSSRYIWNWLCYHSTWLPRSRSWTQEYIDVLNALKSNFSNPWTRNSSPSTSTTKHLQSKIPSQMSSKPSTKGLPQSPPGPFVKPKHRYATWPTTPPSKIHLMISRQLLTISWH